MLTDSVVCRHDGQQGCKIANVGQRATLDVQLGLLQKHSGFSGSETEWESLQFFDWIHTAISSLETKKEKRVRFSLVPHHSSEGLFYRPKASINSSAVASMTSSDK